MSKSASAYYISGMPFSKEGLLGFCHDKLADTSVSDFKRELYLFIIEWFSSSEYIVVKTSGSTGSPKEIHLRKEHMKASARATISYFDLKRNDKVLLCLPMSFIAGKMMVVRALTGNLDLCIAEPSSKPELPEVQMQFSAMVPLQVSSLLKEKPDSLSKIDKLIIGGSFIPDALVQQIQHLKNLVWQTYGMTETMTHIAVRKINSNKIKDWYQPLPGVLVTLDRRRCLVIKAKHLGVEDLKTNDLAKIDKSGSFQILGRVDDMIVSGGLKFNPVSIENKLSEIISNAFFIGSLNDHELGQKLVLFIEKGGNIERQIFNIWRKLEEKLERQEIPKEIIFLDSFSRTTSGKTDRLKTVNTYLKPLV